MKKLFTNDKFFLLTVLCGVVSSIICTIIGLSAWELDIAVLFTIIIRFGCVIVLYISYRRHSKNVMKGMMGALLLSLLQGCISSFSLFGQKEAVFSTLMLILSFLMFVNHFIINSDHHSSPKTVRMNQIIAILLFITNTVWDIWCICLDPNGKNILASVLDIIGFACLVAVIVCVESRLDAFRIDREKACWSERRGYPEGYVHEYQKKK